MANRNPWSPKEIEFLRTSSLTLPEIAAKLGRSLDSVQNKSCRIGRTKPSTVANPHPALPSHDKDRAQLDETYWKRQHGILQGEYKKALEHNVAIDRWMADLKSAAPMSYSAAPAFHGVEELRNRVNKGTPESAVLLLSDTHIGKVTKRSQTLGFSEYNFEIFLSRLKFTEISTISILREHTNSKINELVIAILGDMLDGALNHGVEGGQRNVMFNQFYAGGHAIAQFIRNVAAHVPQIRIKTCVGNHTRFQNQKRMPTENRYSNFDQFLYAYIEALTRDIPNVNWSLDEQPFCVFDVEGWTFMGAHGDHWRGGDKAMGIPLHALARQINSTTQLFHKNGVAVPHYYVSGHLHRGIQLPHGLGDVTINGGFPGLDNYALDGNFNPVDPTQTLFKVHPKYGKTAVYQLQLKHAELGKKTYDLPTQFSVE